MYFGSAGIRLGENFHVSNQGNLYANDGDFEGKIKSGSGEIGGWTINSTNLKAGNITIGSNGAISGGTKNGANWKIENDGTATFTDISITGKNSKWTNGSITGGTISNNRTGGSITGGSIGGGGGSMPTISPGLCKYGSGGGGSGTLEYHFDSIVATKIKAAEGEFENLITTKIDATYIKGKIQQISVINAKGISASSWITAPSIKVGNGQNVGDEVATKSWVNVQQFLTSGDLSNYATHTWVNGKGYATEGYVNGQLLGYATQTWVRNNFQPKS